MIISKKLEVKLKNRRMIMSERNLRTAIYGDYVVFQKNEECDFPVAIFITRSDAEACCGLSEERYVMKRVDDDLLEFGAVEEL